jgi:hypothetical protein
VRRSVLMPTQARTTSDDPLQLVPSPVSGKPSSAPRTTLCVLKMTSVDGAVLRRSVVRPGGKFERFCFI